MRIGFNLEALSDSSFKLVKDKKEYEKKIKSIKISQAAKDTLTALNDKNHEIFIFSPTSSELDLPTKTKIKRQVVKNLARQGIDFGRLAIVDSDEMVDVIRRNHIDISVDSDKEVVEKEKEFTDAVNVDEDKDFNQVLEDIFENIEKNRETILASDTEAKGLPSEDQLWRKEYRIGDFKWNKEEMSPYDRLLSSNIDWLDEQAMEFFGNKLTYKQFFDEVDKLAERMKAAGITKGVRVPAILVNTPESFITIYALYKVKATVAPIFPLEKPEKLREKLAKIEEENRENGVTTNYFFASDLSLGNKKDGDLLSVIPDDMKVIVLPVDNSMPFPINLAFKYYLAPKLGIQPVSYNSQYVSYNDFMGIKREEIKIDEKQYQEYVKNIKQGYDDSYTALKLYTGGTIKAKGVNLSERNIDSSTKQFFNDRFDFRRGDKIAAFMPLNHSFGLIIGTHVAMSLGVNLDVIMKIDFKKIYKLFLKDKVNIFGGIPNMFPSIINSKELKGKKLTHVKYLLSGGAAIDKQIQADGKEFFHEAESPAEIHDGYGQTEDGGGIIYDGTPNMNTIVKIVEPGTMRELGYDEPGELCIHGPQVMQGYDEEALTEDKLKVHPDGKLWLHTGDGAVIHKDGKVQYLDRLDRMIKVNGEQVYLNQIEEEINTLPFVERCGVVKRDDSVRGTVPVVYIKLKEGVMPTQEINNIITEFYKLKFNSSSKPRNTEFIDELPTTAVGKVDFKALEALAAEKYNGQKAI